MARTTRLAATLAVALGSIAALTACEFPLIPSFTVTTTADGRDANTGDGVCEMNAGHADCSLRAAIDEANAAGDANITLPAGAYAVTLAGIDDANAAGDFDVSGTVRLNWDSPVPAEVNADFGPAFDVAGSGKLLIDGVTIRGTVDVKGVGFLRRTTIAGIAGGLPGALTVRTGAMVVAENANLEAALDSTVVANGGRVVLRFSTLRPYYGGTGFATAPGATSDIGASWIESCSGEPPTSAGYNAELASSCAFGQVGDLQNVLDAFDYSAVPQSTPVPSATSPLRDAVPLATMGCGTNVVVDRDGGGRPVDGNLDGLTGCDIGAKEPTVFPI